MLWLLEGASGAAASCCCCDLSPCYDYSTFTSCRLSVIWWWARNGFLNPFLSPPLFKTSNSCLLLPKRHKFDERDEKITLSEPFLIQVGMCSIVRMKLLITVALSHQLKLSYPEEIIMVILSKLWELLQEPQYDHVLKKCIAPLTLSRFHGRQRKKMWW